MAKIIPDGWRELEVTGGAQREIETLAMLAAGLPDSYRVYHAVHWTNVGSGKGFSIYGEIDFIVVSSPLSFGGVVCRLAAGLRRCREIGRCRR